MSVEDLVRDQTRLSNAQTVLQHAAVASLTCTGPRTLGPDRQAMALQKSENISPIRAVYDTVKTVPPLIANKKINEQTAVTDINPSIILDINAINASIVKRELDQECKRRVQQQLKEIKKRQQCALKDQNVAQQLAEQQKVYSSNRIQRAEIDKCLEQQAEQLAKLQLDAQKQEQKALLRQNNHKLHLLTIEGVSRYHSKFCAKYESVVKLMLALDKEAAQGCATFNNELRELGQKFDQLVAKIKSGSNESPELSCVFTAERYCQSLNTLEENLHKQLREQEQLQLVKAKQLAEEKEKQQIQEAEEKKLQEQKQQEQEAQQKATADAAAAAAAAAAASATTVTGTATALPAQDGSAGLATTAGSTVTGAVPTSYVHPSRLAFYNEINTLYQSKVDAVKPLQTDEAWKKYRTNCQRTINVPLNAITASSAQHLTNNFDKLYNFFAGQPVRTTDGSTITINDHPLARDYCILLMAKKFVSQTDTAISSNPQAAFPFASVIVTFWKLIPDFGHIFLAYMYKESPYLVPYVIPQQPGQTPEQYLKTMGYRLSENNELEKPDMFLKRQTGIARLYAAVIITPGRKADGPTHCFGLEEGWRWLTHILFVKPLPDICATMIMEMLQTLGFELWRAYGQNFLKLLLYIQTTYMPQLSAYDEGGPKTRLEMLLSKFLRERQIPQAVGVLPSGFW